MKHGLEDVERMALAAKPRFELEDWLALRSARWFLVNAGQTLFLPANLTHKVITLEPYVGVGGFYIALPNCLRLLAHWINRVPLWSKRDTTGRNDELIGEIAKSVRETILALRDATPEKRQMLGYDYLEEFGEVLPRDLFFGSIALSLVGSAVPMRRRGHSCTLAAFFRRQPAIRALIAKETTGQVSITSKLRREFSLTFPV